MSNFISLHNYTSFSIGQALTEPQELFNKTKELGQTAVGVTDFDTMAGIWESLKQSQKSGIKLIPGCEFNFVQDLKQDSKLTRIVLLAKNHVGYKNILALRKIGFDNMVVAYSKALARIDFNILSKHTEGVICLSGGGNGFIPQLIMKDKLQEARDFSKKFQELFGEDFALELQPHNLQIRSNPYSGDIDQRKINFGLKKIHDELNIPCVVCTNSMYLNPENYEAHDVLLAISSGQPVWSGQRLKYDKNDFYIKSEEQIRNHFARHINLWTQEFVDHMINYTKFLADKCEDPKYVDPKFSNASGKELPQFPVDECDDYEKFIEWKKTYPENSLANDVLYYRYLVELGLKEKLENAKLDPQNIEQYKERIKEELDVLEYHGFSSYMLIVQDYIKYARKNGIPVGPGRGSVGGSFTAYLTGIHLADPFKYGLIFARFHNKEKRSYPDIDTDFSPSGRDHLQEYIRNKYGSEYVAHVSNINTITPKVYARDIARTFEFGDDGRSSAAKIGDDIADSIPNEYQTVKSALENAALFAEYAKQYPELKNNEILGGKARAWSTHAAGLVIGMRPLHEIVPIRRDTHNALCLESDKEDSEDLGLVKMDTLGLETLDIIKKTYEIIRAVGKTPPSELDFDYEMYDQKAYDLISNGDVSCVFQMTGVAAPVCKLIKPKNIEDIASITSLIRPSSKDIIQDFVKVRNGERPIELTHPLLGRALNPTYGFGLYEETLGILAVDCLGWDQHKADGLRKMTKDKGKNPEKVEKLKNDFIHDAQVNKGIPKETAVKIWEMVELFGGYGFNKSHAVLYSMITFQTAYLKANFFLEFMVANLMSKVNSNSPKAKDEVLKIKQEIRNRGVKIVPPDVNSSDVVYKIIDDHTLMTGLDALRNTKEQAVEDIKAKRPFKDFKDLVQRTDASKVRSPVIQALAASGALDSLGMSREHMFFYTTDFRNKLKALRTSLEKKVQKGKLAPEDVEQELQSFNYPFPSREPQWKPHEIFALEEYFLGEGISGTVQDRFPGFFDKGVVDFTILPQKMKYRKTDGNERDNRKANTHNISDFGIQGLKGIIVDIFEFKVKKEDSKIFGQVMARMKVQDPFGNILDIIIWPDLLTNAKDRIERQLSGGKSKLVPGIAIHFSGFFQYESEHQYSFLLQDIISFKDSPKVPKSLKSKKVKIQRKSKKLDISNMKKEDLAEELEEELIFEGVQSLEEEDEFVFE